VTQNFEFTFCWSCIAGSWHDSHSIELESGRTALSQK
jgi:hypothetical protein